MPDLTEAPKNMNIFLELTDQCNLDCSHCISVINHGVKRKSAVIDHKEDLLGLCADILTYGLKAICIHGLGEPTIVPYWTEVADFFIKNNVPTGIQSNFAKRFSEHEIDTLANFSNLRISLDAATHDLCRQLRGGLNLDRLLGNLARIKARCLHKKQPSPFLAASIVLSKQNIDELEALFWLLHAVGIRHIDMQPLFIQSRTDVRTDNGMELRQLDQMTVEEKDKTVCIIRNVIELGQANGIPVIAYMSEFDTIDKIVATGHAEDAAATRDIAACYAPWSDLFIDCNGNITPCCHTLHFPECSLGNVFQQSYFDVLNGTTAKNVRASFCDGRMALSRCWPSCPQVVREKDIETMKYKINGLYH